MSNPPRQSTVNFITYKNFTSSRANMPVTATAYPGKLLNSCRYCQPTLPIYDIPTLDRLAQDAFQQGNFDQFSCFAHAYELLSRKKHSFWAAYEANIAESKELTEFCMGASESALSEVWDTPEEDAAWAHLG